MALTKQKTGITLLARPDFLALLLVISAWTGSCDASIDAGITNSNDSSLPPEDSGNGTYESFGELPRTRNDENPGLVPLFDMVKGFLGDAVMPKTFGDFLEEYEITSWDQFGEDGFAENILQDWQNWLLYIVGFLLCIAVGLVFIILMPITGCCTCCCRRFCCCCRCCCCEGKPSKRTGSSRCKRIICGMLLFGCAGFMAAGVVCSVVVTSLVEKEVSPGGVINDISVSFSHIQDFAVDTLEDFNHTLVVGMTDTSKEVTDTLESIPDDAMDTLEDEFGISGLLADLSYFTDNMEELNNSLAQMETSKVNLQQMTEDLEIQLETQRTNINESLQECLDNATGDVFDMCTAASQDLDKLTAPGNYTVLYDVEPLQIVINTNMDLVDDVISSVEDYQAIADQLYNDTSEQIGDVTDQIQSLEDDIVSAFNDFSETVTDAILGVDGNGTLDDVQEAMDDYSWYYFYALHILSGIFLVGIGCYFMALLQGACCSAPTGRDGDCSCTTHQAANWLIAGNGLIFLFSILFMLCTTLHFTVGGGMELFLCRHIVPYDETMQKIEEVTWETVDVNYNVSIKHAMDSCQEDQTVYYALDMENNGYNVSEVLDLENYGIYDVFEELENMEIDIGNVTLLTANMTDALVAIDEEIDDVDYESYYTELGKPVTDYDLQAYSNEMRAIAAALDGDPLADDFNGHASALEDLYNDNVIEIEKEREVLEKNTRTSDNITSTVNLTELTIQLNEAEDSINSDGSEVVSTMISTYASDMLRLVEDYVDMADDSVREEIARCRSLYDAGKVLVTGPCVYFLEPFNSIWFGYGMALFFAIPAIVFASCMASMYRHVAVPKKKDPEAQDLVMNSYSTKPSSSKKQATAIVAGTAVVKKRRKKKKVPTATLR